MTIAYLDNRTYDSFRLESLGTLVAWYDGNDPHGTGSVSVGDEIETWVDKSENNIHVTQSESDKRPVVVAEGNNYSLQFDGNDMLGVDNATMEEAFSEYTFISVVKSSVSGYKNIMGRNYSVWEYQWHGAAKINMYINNREQDGSSDTYPFDGQARIGLFRYHDANDALDQWIDGTSTFTNNHNQSIPSSTNDFYIGARMGTGEFFNGEMLELIVFSEYLTDTNRERVENYLANKWGLNGDDLEPEDGEAPEGNTNVAPSLGILVDGNINEDTVSEIILSATDADGDALSYSASSDTLAVTATVSNDTLTLTPTVNWNGTSNITVYVSDGSLSDTTAFMLTVSPVNDAPVLNTPLVDATIGEDDFGAVLATALESHFNDIDLDDVLSFSANALAAGFDSLSLSEGDLGAVGRLVNDDSYDKIMTMNRSVKRSSKSTQSKYKTLRHNENKSNLVDLASSKGFLGQNVTLNESRSISLIGYPTGNFFGDVEIVITATDTTGASVSDTMTVTVNAVDDAPVMATISDQSTSEDTAKVVTLSATDADGDVLSYSASSDTLAVTATVSNDTLTLTPAVNWNGTSNITVFVSDGSLSDTTTFVLTVNPVDDKPTTQGLADMVVNEDAPDSTIGDLNTYFTDIDGDLVFSHTNSNPGLVLVNIMSDSASFSFIPDSNGVATIVFTASNPARASVSDTLIVTVNAVNDAPVITLSNQTMNEDESLNVTLSATDADGDVLSYSASSDTLAVTATVSNDTLTLNPITNWNGNANITVIVSDGSLSDTTTFAITVNAVNDAPYITQSMSDITVDEDSDTLSFAINGVFDDIDIINGDSLTITAVSLNTDLITVGSDENEVPYLVFTENGYGETDVIVTATDLGGLSVNDTVHVMVNAVNDAPSAFVLVQGDSLITITSDNIATGVAHFAWTPSTDADGDTIQYTFGWVQPGAWYGGDSITNNHYLDISYQEVYEMITTQSDTTSWWWYVEATDGMDTTDASPDYLTIQWDISDMLSIDDDLMPLSFALHQNYPNPFNPTTTLQYDLPEDATVKIMIYDLMGREVKTLVNNQQTAGFKSIIWNASNNLGQPVSAGMYLYRISAGDFHSVKKMILLK
jgi:hypothetical protein